jgi:uncharacterized protein (TIGR02466 family)
MEIRNIFTNFVAIDFLNLSNHHKLTEYCIKRTIEDRKYIEKNTNQSFFLDIKDQELIPLVEIINTKLEDLRQHLGINDDLSQKIIEMWVNVNNNKNIGIAHSHPNKFLSGVFYVSAEEGDSEIRLMTPIPNHNYVFHSSLIKEYNEFNSSEWIVKPKTGMLLIFPSWLWHYVNITNTESQRISLAFNTLLDGF